MITFYFHLFANILGQCRFNLVHHCVYTRPLVVRWLWCQKSRPLEAYVIKKLIVQSNGVLRMIHRKPIWFDASVEHFLCNLWETRSIEKKVENKITVNLNLLWPLILTEDGTSKENVMEQTCYWAKQLLCTNVSKLTFLAVTSKTTTWTPNHSPGNFLISFLIGVLIVVPSLVLLRMACFQSLCWIITSATSLGVTETTNKRCFSSPASG